MEHDRRKDYFLAKAKEAESRAEALEHNADARRRWLYIADCYRQLARTTTGFAAYNTVKTSK